MQGFSGQVRDIIGGVITVGASRNGGQELTLQGVQAAMQIHDMIIVGDGNSTAHYGGTCWSGMEGGIERDDHGMKTALNTVMRVAGLMSRLNVK